MGVTGNMAFGIPSGIGENLELPSNCWLCGAGHATGIGANGDWGKRYGKDTIEPKWLCEECKHLCARVKEMKHSDLWEVHALDGGVEAVGEYLDTIGIFNLEHMDGLQARMMVKAAWQGCARKLRKDLEESYGELPPKGRKK